MIARPLAAAVVFVAGCAFAQPGEKRDTLRILVRPLTPDAATQLDRIRDQLRLRAGDEVRLPSGGVRFWTVREQPAAARELLAGFGKSIVAEVVDGDPHDLLWPVDPRALPPAVRANFDKIARRTYARSPPVIVRMRGPEFAGPMLKRGVPGDGKKYRLGGQVQWKLRSELEFTSTRVAWSTHDRAGERFAWVGELDIPKRSKRPARYAGGFAAASYDRGNLYARIERGGQLFQVLPLGERYHAVLEVDPKSVPEDQPDRADVNDLGGEQPDWNSPGQCVAMQPDRADVNDLGGEQPDRADVNDLGGEQPDRADVNDLGGEQPDHVGFCAEFTVPVLTARAQQCNEGPKTNAVVRIGVGITGEANAELPVILGQQGMQNLDARHYAQYLIDLLSASFARSGIHARVELAGVREFSGLEPSPPDASKMLNDLWNPAQSVGAPVRKWRDEVGADLVVMLTTVERAATVAFPIAGLSPSKADIMKPASGYSLVVARYADAQLSFLHEIGHHFGASHNPPNSALRFWFGQGHIEGCLWRTVMAYGDPSCPTGVPRNAFWSSCNLWVNNVPAGAPTRNNVRAINSTARKIEANRP